MTYRFAVIGNPIEHSLSPIIHQQFAQEIDLILTYEKILADDKSFEQQVSEFFSEGGMGLNVTLPMKQRAFAFAQEKTPRCILAGAANTLWMQDNTLHADNTDGIGLITDLSRHLDLGDKRILILGAGGATRGVIQPLLDSMPESICVSNRTMENAYLLKKSFPKIECLDLEHLEDGYDLIINATSSSLRGEVISIPNECFENKPFCYDLAYKLNQATPFEALATQKGCRAIDGLGMLVEQAAEAFYIWNGIRPSTNQVLHDLKKIHLIKNESP